MSAALLEAGRRSRAALARRRERAMLARSAEERDKPRLSPAFARMSGADLLAHFRARATPKFLPGFADWETSARLQGELFPAETEKLLADARAIARAHSWPLLGYGALDFGAEINWLRDPVSGARWPRAYHAQVTLVRGDGSDVRVLWELNRLAHLITLGRAYAVTREGYLAEEFCAQVESWRAQNPVGYGPNWSCAMEAALRAINLLAAFELFRRAPELNAARLRMLLALFAEHGAHIRRNLEFSYIATGNHYLSDVAGLFWLGLCLPELRAARAWRDFGWRELLREMDKQVLADGAHHEASTGYHRFALEIFLCSFLLARANSIPVAERHLRKLRAMLEYTRAYLRPDGRAPLIGDTDGGRILPIAARDADDHAYILAVGAAFFAEPQGKISADMPEELLWLAGAEGVETHRKLSEQRAATAVSREAVMRSAAASASQAFAAAGTFVMRAGDLYLLFNVSGAGLRGRGSHSHNDALSIEVSACGVSFIADAGTYVYTADLAARHLFRSTAYHSTLAVDDAEQSATDMRTPFIIGNEARPRALRWETGAERDLAVAEHYGYRRLPAPVTHRRAVMFDKRERYWLVEDTILGSSGAEHDLLFSFHAAPGIQAAAQTDALVELCDKITASRLFIAALDAPARATLEPRASSRSYGAKTGTLAACWRWRGRAPLVARWALVPLCAGDTEAKRLELLTRLQAGNQKAATGSQSTTI